MYMWCVCDCVWVCMCMYMWCVCVTVCGCVCICGVCVCMTVWVCMWCVCVVCALLAHKCFCFHGIALKTMVLQKKLWEIVYGRNTEINIRRPMLESWLHYLLGWGGDIPSEPWVLLHLKYKSNNSCPEDLTGLSWESNEMMNVKVVWKL